MFPAQLFRPRRSWRVFWTYAMEKKFRTEAEEAEYLDKSPATLRRWRHLRIGPPFSRPRGMKEVVYPIKATEEWIDAGLIETRKGEAA